MARRKTARRRFGSTEDVHADKAMAYHNDAEHTAREALRKVREPGRTGRTVDCEAVFDLLSKGRQVFGRALGHDDGAADLSNHERSARRGTASGMLRTAEGAFYAARVRKVKGA